MVGKDGAGGPPSLSWTGVVYDAECGVPRAMMSWGAFAAWIAKDWLGAVGLAPDVGGVCEPLASYVAAILAVQVGRNGRGGVDLSPPAILFNSPQKATLLQITHALAMFYWAAVHADPLTQVLEKSAAKRALEMYLRFGLVVLRKRAYQFHGAGKRARDESD